MIRLSTLLFALTLSFVAYNLNGQTLLWQKTYGGSRPDNSPRLLPIKDGYVFCGATQSFDGNVSFLKGFIDVWLVKLDTAGNIIWEKTIGGAGNDVATNFYRTKDSGFVICGHTYSSNIEGGINSMRGLGDAWLLKLDSSGNVQWHKTYGGTQPDYFFDLVQIQDGGFVITGYTMSSNHDVANMKGGSDLWLVRVNSIGGLVWEKTFGGTKYEIGHSIVTTNDGGYLIAGSATSNDGDIAGGKGLSDGWVLKVNAAGSLQWKKNYGGSDNDDIWKIQKAGSNYILIGETRSNNHDISNHKGRNDAWLFSIDGNGQLQWSKNYGGSWDDAVRDITPAFDGQGYMLTGYSYSYDGDVNFNHDSVSSDVWVLMTNNTGDLQWEHCYGGYNNEFATSIMALSPTTFLFSASTTSDSGDVSFNWGNSDCWLGKVHSMIQPNFVAQEKTPTSVHVFPTVTSGIVHLDLPENFLNSELKVFAITGELILKRKLHGSRTVIDLNPLPAGVYFFHFFKEGKQSHSRVIKQ
ncbi:MAG TPA: T9SS type A sorting domain-containing protein [Flavipsychrobacter sp.]|nr:T9SS type A sorting domain-containing protein [Flavipsychrobacter sp.]